MLICPQCKFENPNTNKFCQHCGTSLVHKVCPECASHVGFSEKRCQNCGAETGDILWAIVWRESTGDGDKALSPAPPLTAGYLDLQQRYQLLEPLPPSEEIAAEVQVRVLDCQPFQVSPLAALVGTGQDSPVESLYAHTQLLEAGDNSKKMLLAIPVIATAYLALQSQFHHKLPVIHDAWQQGDLQVVLIENRSDWPLLTNFWQADHTTSLQQSLHWFYEMTQLWAALEPWHCRQSLLELSNLRVDEDQALGLQRLYTETPDESLTLKDLGQVWQALFRESQRTQFGSLKQLLEDLQSDKVQQVNDLRSRLEAIASEMQNNSPPHVTSMAAVPEVIPITPVVTNETQSLNPPAPEPQVEATTPVLPVQNAAVLPAEASSPNRSYPQSDAEDSLTKSDDMPTIVLPMQLVSLEDAGRTDVGRQRNHNEDFFGIETVIDKVELPKGKVIKAHGLYILCDGMGGHAGGEVASDLAVKTLRQYFQTQWQNSQLPTEAVIREGVRLANQAIYDVNQQEERSGVGRMGTTLVLVLVQDTQVAVAHVGDSRLYRLTRKRGLEQVTVDHEVGQREISRGVEPAIAYARPDAYQLTQALGPRGDSYINPDVQFLDLSEDTLLILVSDGLSDNDLIEHNWHTHLDPLLSSRTNLESGVSDLIDLANQYNGHDNITAVAIRAKVRPNLDQH